MISRHARLDVPAYGLPRDVQFRIEAVVAIARARHHWLTRYVHGDGAARDEAVRWMEALDRLLVDAARELAYDWTYEVSDAVDAATQLGIKKPEGQR